MPKFACGSTQLVRDKLDEDFLDGQGINKLAPTFEERFILLPSSRRGVRPLGKLIHIVAAINHTGLTLGGRFGCSAGGVSVLANRRAVVGRLYDSPESPWITANHRPSVTFVLRAQ